MKNQALFSSKDKSEKFKCRLLQFLFGTLRVSFNNFLLVINERCAGYDFAKSKILFFGLCHFNCQLS